MNRIGRLVPDRCALPRALALALCAQACAGSGSAAKDAAATAGGADSKPTPSPTPGLFCSPGVDPAGPVITEFSAATFNANEGRWVGDPGMTFFTYSYADNNNSSNSDKVEGGVFTFSGQVVPGPGDSYAGGGMHFDRCVNTTTYRGIQFTLTGTAGGCVIHFDLQTYSQQAINEKGGCASYCYHFPNAAVTPRATPITLLFSDLEGTGIPSSAAAMASEIMGMRWQVELPTGQGDAGQTACAYALTVDDVKFVR